MDPRQFQGIEAKLNEWLDQGYQVLADDVEGEIRVTCHFVPRADQPGREREQEHWPRAPEVVELLERRGIVISQTLPEV